MDAGQMTDAVWHAWNEGNPRMHWANMSLVLMRTDAVVEGLHLHHCLPGERGPVVPEKVRAFCSLMLLSLLCCRAHSAAQREVKTRALPWKAGVFLPS